MYDTSQHTQHSSEWRLLKNMLHYSYEYSSYSLKCCPNDPYMPYTQYSYTRSAKEAKKKDHNQK